MSGEHKPMSQTGAALRGTTQPFRLLAESVLDYAIFLLDPRGTVATWNPGAERLLGYTGEEAAGRHLKDFYPREDREAGKCERELKIAGAEGHSADEGWRARKDGSLFWTQAALTALRDGAGELLGYGVVMRDQTERRATEERLRRAEERMRLMVDAVKDYAIFMLDPRGRIESWNPGAQRLKGYAAEEIVGRHFSIFYPKEALESGWPEHELKIAAATGRFEDEGWRVRKDGSRFWANVVISAVRSPNGELLGFTKVTRDLTERRQREEDLRAALEEVRRSNVELDEYAAFVSHDLQEPLRKMAGFAELVGLRYKDKVDPEGRRFLSYIVDGAARMRSLIVDVLDYSRLGRARPDFGRVDLNDTLKTVLSDLEVGLRESGARVHAGPLPAVRGNQQLLGRLLLNLLSNAVKFRDAARPLKITVSGQTENHRCELIVEDNGIGFDPAEAENILRPFARLHPKERYPGTGLGLSTVKKIAELHGGAVRAESNPGQGSRFIIELPCEKS